MNRPHSLNQATSTRDFFYLFALSAVFLFVNLGVGSLASWDEAIYASVSKELFHSGQWLNFTLGHTPWADKPPLCLWATTFFYHLFGVHEFSARFFSALCGLGLVILTYIFGSRLFDRYTGLLSALVLLSSSHFIKFSRFGMMDVPLTFFITLAFYFFWRGSESNRYYIYSGIATGLAFMVKGFAAFFILPVIWVYCVWADEMDRLAKSSYWVGVMIAVVIALPWHIYEMFNDKQLFFEGVVRRHLFERTTRAIEGHAGNAYFYIRTLINKFHPWILIGVFSAPVFLWKAMRKRSSREVFLCSWMFVILAALTLVQTKLAWYIIPVYPALSMTIAYYVAKVFDKKNELVVKIVFVLIMAGHVPYSHIWDHDYSAPVKALAPAVEKWVPENATLCLYDYHEAPAVFFYMDRKNVYIDDTALLSKTIAASPMMYILIPDKRKAELLSYLQAGGLAEKASAAGLTLFIKKSA